MADAGQAILIIRALGVATVTVGALKLAVEADILFMLALVLGQRAGERIGRSELRALIWPSATDESARHTLRQALYRLHKAGLVTEDHGDDLSLDPALVDSDLTRILANDWPEHAEPQEIESAATVLPGVTPREQGALAEFVETLRARAAGQYRRAVLRRIAAVKREGRWREVEHWALMCLQADPLNEEATLSRAEAAAMVGAKYEALEILDSYLAELGDRAKVIGLPARMLRKRVSELTDTSNRKIKATSVPFVGRHEVIAKVQDMLATARHGFSDVLWLLGPPGIGKSRLLRELERLSLMNAGTVIRVGARLSYLERPYALMTEMLPYLLDAPGALGAAPNALSMMRQMGRADARVESLPPDEARSRRHAIWLCWLELLDAVLSETSVTLMVDDAQWSDSLSLELLARVIESRPSARLGVVIASRLIPTFDDRSLRQLLCRTQLRVGPLTEADVRDYTHAAGLGAEVDYESITKRLARASGGNPLFLSHLLNHQWLQNTSAALPSDLASLMDVQLRTLSPEALRLLQACTLLGRHSTLSRLERVIGMSAQALVPAFCALDDLLLLPVDTDAPLAPHDLWAERIRSGMTASVFRALAVSTARVLESDASQDHSIELHWDAAKLFRDSGEKQLAFATMMSCAGYLLKTGAVSEASRAFIQAELYASNAFEAIEALKGRIRGQQAMSELNSVRHSIATLEELCSTSGSGSLSPEFQLLALEAQAFTTAAESVLDELEPIARDARSASRLRLRAVFLGMSAADNLHDAAAIRRFWEIGHTVALSSDCELERLRINLVREAAVGDLDEAVRIARDFVVLARQQQSVAELTTALRHASYAYRRAGDWHSSLQLLMETSELAIRNNFGYTRFRAADIRAGLSLEYEEFDSAQEALQEAEEYFAEDFGEFFRESIDISWAFYAIATEQWDLARTKVAGRRIDLNSRSRHELHCAAAALRVCIHDGQDDRGRVLLDYIQKHNKTLLVHSSVDHIATATYVALNRYGSTAEAQAFARQFLLEQRRDRMPVPKLLSASLV